MMHTAISGEDPLSPQRRTVRDLAPYLPCRWHGSTDIVLLRCDTRGYIVCPVCDTRPSTPPSWYDQRRAAAA